MYYEEKCGNKPDDLDHAVLAVGFGVMDGEVRFIDIMVIILAESR